MQMLKCCGKEMQPVLETPKFSEMRCELCGDIVYVKKEKIEKPKMIDD